MQILLPNTGSTVVPRPVLAPRAADPARILLFDNGKLDSSYGAYHVLFDVVRSALNERHPAAVVEERTRNLLVGTSDELADQARELRASGVDAVVIALCDTGVSQPSALLAATLERLGVPTALICQGIGGQMARTTLTSLGVPVPCFEIDAIRTASADGIRREFEPLVGDLAASLSGPIPLPEPTTVRVRATEAELTDPTAFTELAEEWGIGDGLPLVPPTPDRVTTLLAAAGVDADEQVWPVVAPRTEPLVAGDVAVVAAMAGCRPEWMWAVLAAYRGLAHPDFRLFQAAVTTHPSGTLVLVSGPRAAASGIASGPGCLGPGFPANLTVGRAVALAYRVFFGARPGEYDLTRQGSPAEIAYCCAENTAQSPWPGRHADLGHPDRTTVTVLKCEGPRNVLDNLSMTAEGLLDSVADAMTGIAANNAFNPTSQTVVLLNPEHARIVAEAGWSKQDAQRFLFERARVDAARLVGRGSLPKWPAWFTGLDRIPVVCSADDVLLAVAGGPGPQSQVALPWGLSRAITVPVEPGPVTI